MKQQEDVLKNSGRAFVISDLMNKLNKLKDDFGDLEVLMLDQKGAAQPCHAIFFYREFETNRISVVLINEQQSMLFNEKIRGPVC